MERALKTTNGLSIELTFGVAMEAVRLERGMSLDALADRTGIPVSILSDYEAAVVRAPSSDVVALAQALDTSISRLFGVDP